MVPLRLFLKWSIFAWVETQVSDPRVAPDCCAINACKRPNPMKFPNPRDM